MEIREAVIDDMDSLNGFYIKMNEIINVRTDKYNPDNPVFPSKNMIMEAIRDRGQFVGIEDGQIVTACIVNHECAQAYKTVQWQMDIPDSEFYVLHALRVSPDYEGRGLAKQMLEYIYQTAKKRCQKAIRLDVLEGYSAESLYISCGYKYVDTVDIFYEGIGYPQRFRLFERLI